MGTLAESFLSAELFKSGFTSIRSTIFAILRFKLSNLDFFDDFMDYRLFWAW